MVLLLFFYSCSKGNQIEQKKLGLEKSNSSNARDSANHTVKDSQNIVKKSPATFSTLICGTWEKTSEVKHKPKKGRPVPPSTPHSVLKIYSDGAYHFQPSMDMQEFPGVYQLSSNTIQFIDAFCGRKLTGIYSIVSLDSNAFEVRELDDKYCARHLLLPGKWSRSKKNN